MEGKRPQEEESALCIIEIGLVYSLVQLNDSANLSWSKSKDNCRISCFLSAVTNVISVEPTHCAHNETEVMVVTG